LASTNLRLRLERVHILPRPKSTREASTFIVNSLLLSHGIRSDATAIVRIGDAWIVAPGASLRHLRPDSDSAEGWLRAVLRGRRLGAFKLGCLEDVLKDASPACIYYGRESLLAVEALERLAQAGGRLHIMYLHGPDEDVEVHCSLLEALPLPPYLAVAVVNIMLDRVQVGLKPLPQGEALA